MATIITHTPWTKFDAKDMRTKPDYYKNPVPCPKCQGHTACIATENAYGEGVHFKLACNQCGGMCPIGWVEAAGPNAKCIHDFQFHATVGRCLTDYKCSKCGQMQTIDSSD